ncbi:hypothetical protein CO151_13385 [bacterium CG_4_9_14_3_um_filter_65_15]|nr:MAG: hypothetical protein CO151_13385 [bacterium CG_4_9_14_3_um_filter_65_15]
MRDSLDLEDLGLELNEMELARLEQSIDQVGSVVERIGVQLGRMDLQIKDNRISLLDEAGEGIVINIPENLDEHISQGLNTLSQLILSDLPDSVHVADKGWTWSSGFRTVPPRPRKIVTGNLVKIGDDVLVAEDEDVRGNVVVIGGNAEIAGRVQGDVVVVLGDLQVGGGAEIEGQTVTVGGSLDQDPGASMGEVTVIDPLPNGGFSPYMMLGRGWLSFFFTQSLFVVVLIMAGLTALLTPARRFEAITGSLRREPLVAMGIGVLAALVGHLVLFLLGAILVLTVIGLPLALLLGLGAALVSLLAVAVVGAVVGDGLCRSLGRQCPSPVLAVVVGLCILHSPVFIGALLGAALETEFPLLALGGLGLLIKVIAYFLGLGALLKSRLGKA